MLSRTVRNGQRQTILGSVPPTFYSIRPHLELLWATIVKLVPLADFRTSFVLPHLVLLRNCRWKNSGPYWEGIPPKQKRGGRIRTNDTQ
jgi:hypothetical protein